MYGAVRPPCEQHRWASAFFVQQAGAQIVLTDEHFVLKGLNAKWYGLKQINLLDEKHILNFGYENIYLSINLGFYNPLELLDMSGSILRSHYTGMKSHK